MKESINNRRCTEAYAVITRLVHLRLLGGLFLSVLVSCSGSQARDGISDGWVDADTFRAKTSAVPGRNLSGKSVRRADAKKIAVMMAQKMILKKFWGCFVEQPAYGGIANLQTDETMKEILKELDEPIQKGAVIRETYNEDDMCEIVYQVKEKGLKRKITGFVELR